MIRHPPAAAGHGCAPRWLAGGVNRVFVSQREGRARETAPDIFAGLHVVAGIVAQIPTLAHRPCRARHLGDEAAHVRALRRGKPDGGEAGKRHVVGDADWRWGNEALRRGLTGLERDQRHDGELVLSAALPVVDGQPQSANRGRIHRQVAQDGTTGRQTCGEVCVPRCCGQGGGVGVIVGQGRRHDRVTSGLGRQCDACDGERGGPVAQPLFAGLRIPPPLGAAELRGVPVTAGEQQRTAQRRDMTAFLPRQVVHAVGEPQRAHREVLREELHRPKWQREPLPLVIHVAGIRGIRLQDRDGPGLLVFRAERPRRDWLPEGNPETANLPSQRGRAPDIGGRAGAQSCQHFNQLICQHIREPATRFEGRALGRINISGSKRQSRGGAF